MKKSVFIILVLIYSISLFSCSKKEDPKPVVKTWIMGTWVRVAATGSLFSNYIELHFENETSGHSIDLNGNSGYFAYSLSDMKYKGLNSQWQINKISDSEISIGTHGVTIMTYYTKQ